MTPALLVSAATAADLDAILEIEAHSFATPWPRSTFETELAAPHARLVAGRLRAAGPLIAFANYWIVTDELNLHAIATHPDHRRTGLGAVMLDHVLADGRRAACTLATLEVRAGNRPAIALYTRAGFATVHTRARYYQDNAEDALVMALRL